ncbi:hypothetical protein FA13DRAFT_1790080 [Coprinellus micaceus]|uniref:Cytochrome c oxidase assembly protein n=1 Tax=Coprinellus micaceus TaxID=71717 RepID=A0A4Y7TFQ1_COPMI|nr:hypothetical protein FA13DRAFT_1790080 [Coprinellus micaceus]
MSLRKAKITLAGAMAFSALTIWAVHFQQNQEAETMYQGVLRDDERRREKMKQRQEDFERSQEKRRIYEAVQKVGRAEP